MLRKKTMDSRDPLYFSDQALRPSVGTGKDSSIRQANRTVLVINQRQEEKQQHGTVSRIHSKEICS